MAKDNDKAEGSALRIHTADRRGRAYTRIADVHKQVLQAKWMAKTKGGKLLLSPEILGHLEEAVAFLAQELLTNQAENEKRLNALEATAKELLDVAENE